MSISRPIMQASPQDARREVSRQVVFLLLVIAFGVAFRLAMISYAESSPYPLVDIYYADTQAAHFILDLRNPYVQSYVIHNYTIDFYTYLPVVPIFYAPFAALGDIRYANIFADILIMLALYWIGSSFNKKYAIFAALTYSVLPMSLWLTSVTASNIMIGAAFLLLCLAALLKERHGFAALLLGLGMASSQFIALTLPFLGYYFWSKRKPFHLVGAISISAAIVLPFLLANPSRFIYGVFTYQIQRPPQVDGPFSLFNAMNSIWGIQINIWLRAAVFLALTVLGMLALRRKALLLVPLTAAISASAAFFIPVNGFWNYFLPAVAMVAGLVPAILEEIEKRTGIHVF